MDFGAQLFAQVALEKITQADADRIVAEFAARVDEAGNFFRRQRGMSHQQSEMQADAELGIFLRQRHGFVAAGFVHHQAGGGQNAFAMRADDGFVDGMRTAKVIRVDDEAAGHWTLFGGSGLGLPVQRRKGRTPNGLGHVPIIRRH